VKLRDKQHLLREGAFNDQDPLQLLRIEPDDRPRLTWPSGISWIDIRGGFANVATIAGFPKLGKSMVCLRSALLAAEQGWRTFYFDGENPTDVFSERISWHLNGTPYHQWPQWLDTHFDSQEMKIKCNLESIADHVAEMIMAEDDRVLVVIDSVNRLARRMAAKGLGKYLENLISITSWAGVCARESYGALSFMLVSETNRAGGAVGMNIEYETHLMLSLHRGSEDHMVKLNLFNRSGPGGDIGEYERKTHTACGLFAPGENERHWTDREEDGENEPPPFKPDPDLGF
jgi:hypothetical protein